MPKVIKAAVIAAAAVFITIAIVASGGTLAPLFTSGALAFGTGALAVAAQYAIVTFVGSVVAGGIGMLTSRGISATSQNFGTKIAGRGAQVPRQIVYGECRVGGTIVKMHTSGTKNNKLHLAIVLAGHEIESLIGVYLNDTLLTTTSSTISGETVFRVSNSKYKNSDNENAITSGGVLIQYTFHDGSQTAVDGLASANASSRYPSTAKFLGMAYVYMEIIYDPEKMSGLPPLHFRVRGKKVYDPRTTNTAWTANPALIIRDFLTDTTYGLRALSSEINDTTSGGGFAAAANACDVDVTLADNSSTEDRFTLNGFVNAAAAGDAVLEGFLSSCAGKITYTNGKFNLFVGTAQTPSLTINDDDVLDSQQLTTKSGNGDLFNGIKALYVDKDQNYQGAESPTLVDSTYLAEDTPSGEQSANYKKILETQLPFTVTHTMAQRLQKIQLKRHRESATLSVLTALEFMKLQPGDWVSVNNTRLSFSAKTFEVLSTQMEFAENEGVIYAATRLTLQEVSAGIYNYIYSEYSTPQTPGSTPPGGDLSVGTPTAGSLTQRTRREGPTAKIDIIASWTNAVQAAVQGTEIQYKESGESSYDTATIAGRGQTTAVINNVQVGKTYDVRIRHFSWDNVYGAFVDYSQITIAEPDTIAAPGNPTATTDKPFFIELTFVNPANVNFRAVEVHVSTSTGFTPDSSTLLNTYVGEPGKQKKIVLGKSQGLLYDTNYYFKLRSINVYGTASGYTNQALGKFTQMKDADVESISANKLTAGTIDADVITVNNIDVDNVNAGTLDAQFVASGGVVVAGLQGGVTIDSGSITMSAGGHIKGGQTGFNSGTGFFIGYDTDAYKLSVGDSSANSLTFNGTNLAVSGNLTAGSFTLSSGATLTDADGQITNLNNNAFFRFPRTVASEAVAAPTDTEFNTQFGRNPRNRDCVIVVNTGTTPDTSAAYIHDGTNFVLQSEFITGDVIVDGTVVADKLNVNQLSAISGDLGTLTAGIIDATDVDIENLTVNNIAGDISTIDTFSATNLAYANQTAVAKDMVAIAAQTHAYRPFVTVNATALLQDNMTVWGELQMRVNLAGSKSSIGTVSTSQAGIIDEFLVLNAYVILPTTSTVAVGDLIGLTSDSNASFKVVGISSFANSLFVYVKTTAGAFVTTAPPTGAYSKFGQTSSYVTVSKSYVVERSGTSWKPMFFQGALEDSTTNSVDVRIVFYRSNTITGSTIPTTSSGSKSFGIFNIQGTVMLAR